MINEQKTLTLSDLSLLLKYHQKGIRAALATPQGQQIKPLYANARLVLYAESDVPRIKAVVAAHRDEVGQRLRAVAAQNMARIHERNTAARANSPTPPEPPPAAPTGPVIATLSPELVGLIDGMFVEHTKEVGEQVTRATELLTMQHRILLQHIDSLHKLVAKLVGELQGEVTT